MNFAAIPHGTSVFIDANPFVYYAVADPRYGASCKYLLQRVASQEIVGISSAHVLGDVAHRVMTLEAIHRFGWPAKGIAARLRKNPAEIQKLTRFRQALEELNQLGVASHPVDSQLVHSGTALCQQHGLLFGDGLVLAVMQQHGLTALASLDDDFDRVPGLSRYAP